MSGKVVKPETRTISELKACPIETTFKVVGKKWTILILREMFNGSNQFNRLSKNIEGINSRMLSIRLKELSRYGIIRRRIISEEPIRIDYQLTDIGRKLLPLLTEASKFSLSCLPSEVYRDGRPRTSKQIPKHIPVH
ncbi:MAG: helix-turn-helix domain-containing protein [Thaumarchaeota archaeon]|nr:helix-turn-helix domain-containing protein [Nitrososphaerota archaeon]